MEPFFESIIRRLLNGEITRDEAVFALQRHEQIMLETQLQQLAKPAVEWVSVKDRLPKDGELIIFFDSNGTFPATFFKGKFINIESSENEPWVAAYWMPLPKSPNAKAQDD